MQYTIHFLKAFGIPEDIADKVVAFRVKDHYFWAVEKKGELRLVYCAYDKDNIYDGKDETLCDKIVTTEDLIFGSGEMAQTVVLEKYQNDFDPNDTVYIATSLREQRCLYQH
ncbi:MAG: hypothetical protein KAI66_08570 [Lentisphaeria bacterium]|nr:hypothetical protein [Lentisphaeria bacterium]